MRLSATGLVDAVARRVPVGVARSVIRRGVLGVNYHVVSDEHLPHIEHVLQYKSVAAFETDLHYLGAHFDVISYGQAVEDGPSDPLRYDRQKRHGNSLMLTFDDGYAECFSVVRPVLRRHGVDCVFFVITDAVDNAFLPYPNKVSLCIDALVAAPDALAADLLAELQVRVGVDVDSIDGCARWLRSLHIADSGTIDEVGTVLGLDWDVFLRDRQPFMSSDQLRQLVAEGFTVGAHSRRHPYMKTLPDREAIEEEIVESCRAVQQITGQARVPFAFPFSADGLDRAQLEGIVARHDVVGLLFNTRELERDRAFMVNRVAGDGGMVPYGDGGLPAGLGEAYRRHMIRSVHTALRRARLAGRNRS